MRRDKFFVYNFACVIYLLQQRNAAVATPAHLLQRIKQPEAVVMELSLKLYVAATGSDGWSVGPDAVIA